MVLVLVLVIVVMVSLAGFSFVATMSNEDKATRMRGEEIQAEQLMRSGQEMVRLLLEMPVEAVENAGGLYDNEDLFRGVLVFQDEALQQRGRFTVISPRLDGDQIEGIRYGLENESAKLNLAVLMAWDKERPGAARDALLQLPSMTESAAEAILDWMDADSAPRASGAEADYYQTLSRPYTPRNAAVECLEEMLMIRDVSRELLYGWDANRNYELEPAEMAYQPTLLPPSLAPSPQGSLPWTSLLTVLSAERNVNPQGKPRLDLNDKDLSRLQQGLSEAVGQPLANFIIAYRQYGPYEGSESPNVSADTSVDIRRPGKFRIESPLDLVNARVRLSPPSEEGETVQVMESPLSEQSFDYGERLLALMDYATVFPQPVIRGRINVNLAPAPVLQAVPGMEQAIVQQILSARQSRSGASDPTRRHPVWLMLDRLVTREQMKKLLPYLTCGGDVHRAQIVGFYDGGGPAARAEVVFDATQRPVQQVYWKDLRILGRGYSLDVLGSEGAAGVDDLSRFSRLTSARRFP